MSSARLTLRDARVGERTAVWTVRAGRFVLELVEVVEFTADRAKARIMNPITGRARWCSSAKPCGVSRRPFNP